MQELTIHEKNKKKMMTDKEETGTNNAKCKRRRKKGKIPVKNVTRISSCLFDRSLVENETKSDHFVSKCHGNSMT